MIFLESASITELKKDSLQSISILVISVLAASSATASSPADTAPERGYQNRACGFDMNRNGIVGEDADCKVCDGSTADPDGDGMNEDMIYIDCERGNDEASCGSTAQPCRTIDYAWNERADGPQDGAEDILCFRNVCRDEENTAPGVSGIPGYYTKPQTGSEARDWQFPSQPTMLVGWDSDADGEYPPFDQDDIAVLDGGAHGLTRALHFNKNGRQSYIEVGHFTAQDYGRYSVQDHNRGFLQVGKYGPESTHIHFHDLALIDINRGLPSQSTTSIINYFRGGTQPRYWAFTNLEITGMASWLVRGSGPNEAEKENGPLRFQSLSVTAHGCPYEECGRVAATTMFKLWGYVSGIEILDSVLDLNAATWSPGGNPSNAFTPAQCSRDWTIRNNELIDFQKVLNVKGYAPGFCDGEMARTTDEIVFDRNLVHGSYDWGKYGDPHILIQHGHSQRETTENVTITNNIFSSTYDVVSCLWVKGGNTQGPNPGTITFAGNTCAIDSNRLGAIMIGLGSGGIPLYPHQSFVIKNNLFNGLNEKALNLRADYTPLDWDVDHNVFDPDAGFEWSGVRYGTLAEWQAVTLGNTHSKVCTPKLKGKSTDSFHLSPSDRCAKDAGVALGMQHGRDIDGDPRGQDGIWDIGADEESPGSAKGP